jgi:anti-sigma factor RsiW
MITCKDIEEKLTAYQEGVLSPEEKGLVENHLAACTQCTSALAGLKKTVDLLKELPEVEPPPWFTQKIMAQVRQEAEEKNSLLKRLFYPFHIKIPIEAFATLCVVALGLYVYKTSGPEIKTYQAPPAAIVEAPAKDVSLSKPVERTKTIALPETESDKEILSQKEPRPQPSVQADAQRASSEPIMERKEEIPAATGVAPPAPIPSMAKEKDASVSVGAERKAERAEKAFRSPSRSKKADIKIQALNLSVENIASASTDIEKVLGQSGITLTKREFKDGLQTLIVHCPAQKLQWLLGQLRTIGEIKDYHEMPEVTDGDLQIIIRLIPR